MGGRNVPFNPSTSYGQGNQQYQQPPQLGPFIPNSPYQQPYVRAGNVPLSATPPKGAVTSNLLGTNLGALLPLGDPKILAMSLSWEDSTPPNKVDLPHLTPTNPKRGDTTSSLAKRAKIPNRGCINNRINSILECLMVVLGYMETNIPIIKISRTCSHQRSCHF
jgi:hypothetical protein